MIHANLPDPSGSWTFGLHGERTSPPLRVVYVSANSLLSFLQMSFHGGTDVQAPFERATDRLELEGWIGADILLVTDGEFPVPEKTAARVRDARAKHGVRVHCVLVGGTGTADLDALCDHVQRVSDAA